MINEETSLTAKIKSSRSDVVVSTGEKFIEVEVEIFADGVLNDTKKFGFPYDTPVELIITDIKKTLGNIKLDAQNAIANEESEKVDQIIETTVNTLAGGEISE
jgi:hypothetical protein